MPVEPVVLARIALRSVVSSGVVDDALVIGARWVDKSGPRFGKGDAKSQEGRADTTAGGSYHRHSSD
ncbi:MAG: hypothetical protein ACR2KO_06975 [Geodermatophilaceae bacterium]